MNAVFLFLILFIIGLCLCQEGHTHFGRATSPSGANKVSYTDYPFGPVPRLVPADSSLHRPEDGHAFPDGTIIVTDCRSGLRRISADLKTSEPFGHFNAEDVCANGLYYDDKNGPPAILTVDMNGRIWEVDINTQETKLLYQDNLTNDLVRDSKGTIWVTISVTNNSNYFTSLVCDKNSEYAWNTAGYLLRIQRQNGEYPANSGEIVYIDPGFPNGVAMDKDETFLYIAECSLNRVIRFPINADGSVDVTKKEVYARLASWVDDLAMDDKGYLYIGLPLLMGGAVVTPKSRTILNFSVPGKDVEEIDEVANADEFTTVLFKTWVGKFGTTFILSHDKKTCFFGNVVNVTNSHLRAFDFPINLS